MYNIEIFWNELIGAEIEEAKHIAREKYAERPIPGDAFEMCKWRQRLLGFWNVLRVNNMQTAQ